ncbi:MAG: DNA (cytosine-5-)-methyltransferase [Gammaproteobacteria bacterium]|nr:DNA (cytosine-5-)-methyltransferase [Gammaproteobacteria bacterium]
MLSNIRYIDLFAGIGGFHQAMSHYNAQCVFASEWDKNCNEIYTLNYGMEVKGDITAIHEKDIPEHDVICAGFPCQAFSISGKQRGFSDTRGTLFFDVARIIQYHHPKLVILENVKNFAKHDSGKTLETVKSTLNELGYSVFHKVLNASHFGVPQKRERIYIIAFRNDLNINHFNFPSSYGKPSPLYEHLLPDNETTEFIIDRKDIVFNKKLTIEKDSEGFYPKKSIRLGIVNKGGQGERIYSPLGHAITLSAYGGGVGSKTGLYLINDKIRKLAPRECARIMGFPDNFKLSPNKNTSYKQFGNSVVINVLIAIIDKIQETLIQQENKLKHTSNQ